MDLTDVRALMSHMAWADALTWRCVLGTPAAHDDDRVRHLVVHIHVVQNAYVTIWNRKPLELPARSAFAQLDDVYAWGRTKHEEVAIYLARLAEDALTRPVVFPWASGLGEEYPQRYGATLAETFQQVAIHSAHHRGQLLTRMRELGAKPPLVDFIAWVWLGKPLPDWRPMRMRA